MHFDVFWFAALVVTESRTKIPSLFYACFVSMEVFISKYFTESELSKTVTSLDT
jgi:hypothetical protein